MRDFLYYILNPYIFQEHLRICEEFIAFTGLVKFNFYNFYNFLQRLYF